MGKVVGGPIKRREELPLFVIEAPWFLEKVDSNREKKAWHPKKKN